MLNWLKSIGKTRDLLAPVVVIILGTWAVASTFMPGQAIRKAHAVEQSSVSRDSVLKVYVDSLKDVGWKVNDQHDSAIQLLNQKLDTAITIGRQTQCMFLAGDNIAETRNCLKSSK